MSLAARLGIALVLAAGALLFIASLQTQDPQPGNGDTPDAAPVVAVWDGFFTTDR